MLQMLSRFFVPKKLIAVLIVLVVLIAGIFLFQKFQLSAGAVSQQDLSRIAANLSGGFTANLDMDYGDFESDAVFEQKYIGDSTFRFTSPPSLNGFELTVSDGKVGVSYRGISSNISNDQLFTSSGAGLFLKALENLTSMQGLKSKMDEGVLELSLVDENGRTIFSADLDPVDGKLFEVEFPLEDFSVDLSNFSFTSGK